MADYEAETSYHITHCLFEWLHGFEARTVIDVGFIGLDTSHGEAFASAVANHDNARLRAIWDSGMVRSQSYINNFSSKYNVFVYDEPFTMVDDVDAVMILSVDWNHHRMLATPFLNAGIPTCIDKPVVGCVEDLNAVVTAAGDTPLFGGSALPYHPAFADIPSERLNRRLYCVGYGDPFYYGAHLADLACYFTAADWTAVEPSDESEEFEVVFDNKSRARLFLNGPDTGGAFGLLDVSDNVRTALASSNPDSYAEMYRRYLESFISVSINSEKLACPLNGARLILAMEAARKHDQRITPDSDVLTTINVESSEFISDYSGTDDNTKK